jgi:hypothetical protein
MMRSEGTGAWRAPFCAGFIFGGVLLTYPTTMGLFLRHILDLLSFCGRSPGYFGYLRRIDNKRFGGWFGLRSALRGCFSRSFGGGLPLRGMRCKRGHIAESAVGATCDVDGTNETIIRHSMEMGIVS